MERTLAQLVRPNILALKAYSSARDEFQAQEGMDYVYFDANENPNEQEQVAINRYPDPRQITVKKEIGRQRGLHPDNLFLGNGSDEAIDVLFRVFCEPRLDNVVAINPSYGMYAVCAHINDVALKEVPLNNDFSLNVEAVQKACDAHTKMIFLCSPNNPSGNLLKREHVLNIIEGFDGIVILDEAYIDFAPEGSSWCGLWEKYPRLVVLQTFSKAWGAAAIRLGLAWGSTEIIELMNKVKYPYNVNLLTQKKALEVLANANQVQVQMNEILSERNRLLEALEHMDEVEEVFPTDANFILVRVKDANALYDYLIGRGVIVRNRHKQLHCENCLRITVGLPHENTALLKAIEAYSVK